MYLCEFFFLLIFVSEDKICNFMFIQHSNKTFSKKRISEDIQLLDASKFIQIQIKVQHLYILIQVELFSTSLASIYVRMY
jgi:hypothetical protein